MIQKTYRKLTFNDIKEISYYKFKKPNDFNISWHITDKCNYNCSYCYDIKNRLKTLKENSIINYNDIDEKILIDKALNIRKLIDNANFPENVKTIHLTLIGGEVSLINSLDKLIEILSKNSKYRFTIVITTNLSNTFKYYKNIIDKCFKELREIDRLSILGSYHSEFADRLEYTNKLIELHNYGISNNFNTLIKSSVVMRLDNFNEVKQLNKIFAENNITQTIRRCRLNGKLLEYPKDINDWLNEYGTEYKLCSVKLLDNTIQDFPIEMIKSILYSNSKFTTYGKFCKSNAIQIRGIEVRDSPCTSNKVIGTIYDDIKLEEYYFKDKVCDISKTKICSFGSNFEIQI